VKYICFCNDRTIYVTRGPGRGYAELALPSFPQGATIESFRVSQYGKVLPSEVEEYIQALRRIAALLEGLVKECLDEAKPEAP
jgi:hypothetical protein